MPAMVNDGGWIHKQTRRDEQERKKDEQNVGNLQDALDYNTGKTYSFLAGIKASLGKLQCGI